MEAHIRAEGAAAEVNRPRAAATPDARSPARRSARLACAPRLWMLLPQASFLVVRRLEHDTSVRTLPHATPPRATNRTAPRRAAVRIAAARLAAGLAAALAAALAANSPPPTGTLAVTALTYRRDRHQPGRRPLTAGAMASNPAAALQPRSALSPTPPTLATKSRAVAATVAVAICRPLPTPRPPSSPLHAPLSSLPPSSPTPSLPALARARATLPRDCRAPTCDVTRLPRDEANRRVLWHILCS
ncbi:hypothetical protein OAO87_00770 [bacterium]|nr:hypothetical protein [bacterium]